MPDTASRSKNQENKTVQQTEQPKENEKEKEKEGPRLKKKKLSTKEIKELLLRIIQQKLHARK